MPNLRMMLDAFDPEDDEDSDLPGDNIGEEDEYTPELIGVQQVW